MESDPAQDLPLVLVVDDEPKLGEHIAWDLTLHGMRVACCADYEEALRVVVAARPAVIVLDQIVETAASREFLRALEQIDGAPWVVLLRYERGPTGPFRRLRVTVVGGEDWFEALPAVVRRRTTRPPPPAFR